ncbi:MAG: glycosyltransferase family 39 protein [Cyanobacteriota bacterium]|nr:glycosyltransferase family 39 protein [Cyanobacteriota bacterium]
MMSRHLTYPSSPQFWLKGLVTLVLILGIFFRFYHIDKKVYWHDEAFASMRISGYSGTEVEEQLYDGSVIQVKDLQKYQSPSPEKDLGDTVQVLTEYAEHTPLYYLLARFWIQAFGASVATTRLLSVLISLLALPLVYWLCQELFPNSLTPWIAIAIISISPIHVLYAQEARQYSLWIVLTLLSHAALLYSLRTSKKISWGIYAITVALGLYVHLLFALVLVAHTVYIISVNINEHNQKISAYFVSLFLGIIAFVPWIFAVINNPNRIQRFTTAATSREWIPETLFLVKSWARNLNNTFFDFAPSLRYKNPIVGDDYFLIIPISVLIVYAMYFLVKKSEKNVYLFVGLITFVPALVVISLDLFLGGVRSIAFRYLFPSYLGIQLTVAHLFAQKLTSDFSSSTMKQVWKIIFVTVLSGGIISCIISSQSDAWWNKFVNYKNPEAARIINQSVSPLVVSDTYINGSGSILSLSHLLEPKVRLQLGNVDRVYKSISPKISDIFLFEASPKLRKKLEQEQEDDFELILRDHNFELWKSKS